MVVEILQQFFGSELGTTTLLLLFIIFIFFVRRIIRVAINGVWIAFVSALFPLFLRFGLGMDVALTYGTFVFYITLGLGLFCVYLLAKIIYRTRGALEKGASSVAKPEKETKKK